MITTPSDIAAAVPDIELHEEERNWFRSLEAESGRKGSFRFAVPEYYASLIDPNLGPEDPIRRQCIPSDREFITLPYETHDPLSEDAFQLSSRLVRRYKSRALFLVTDQCLMYCRHCFRRRFSGTGEGAASEDEVHRAAEMLKSLPEVKELLLSGGDPCTLSSSRLLDIVDVFRSYREDLVIRIATRVPVVDPERFDLSLIDGLAASALPVYLVVQFNHPREITPSSEQVTAYCVDNGIPVMNQTVLLRGVNDQLNVLEELMNRLVRIRVIPMYLFQGDLAAGTSHFRVPLQRGYALERKLRENLSGLAMPQYAVDLPAGGGKIPLTADRLAEKSAESWSFRSYEGTLHSYPVESD